MTSNTELEKIRPTFKDHLIEVITSTKHTQHFRCQRKGTWQYGFEVVVIPGMIAMMGDIGELVVTPGYGRGIGWLRGSIESTSYFVEKISQNMSALEYDHSEAVKQVEEMIRCHDPKHESEIIAKLSVLLEDMEGNDEFRGHDFYRAWHDLDLDDPPEIKVVRNQIWYQIAALEKLCEELDRINFEVEGDPKDESSSD